ncbi:TIGR02186 family protein [Rhodospirillum sp. A1_3_36]|uniref:TIGR02186 family protein n=1 Tax=Rhodospirillum sp. A1_3_36 TaxID=3391666 RepID=UPI0039A46984
MADEVLGRRGWGSKSWGRKVAGLIRLTGRFRKRAAAVAALLSCVFVALAAHAQVQPLVADLSKHLVAITTAFTGTDVLLFGATDGPGDVVMVVRGPSRSEVVRRKDHMGVIWVNKESVTFDDVPTFYRVASNRPMKDFARPEVLARHQIGVERLSLPIRDEYLYDDETQREFRDGFLRLKRKAGLYGAGGDSPVGLEDARIAMLDNRLFRVNLYFPANVPVGSYIVEVYLFRDGEVVSAEITPLVISKIGVGAEIYDFAHEQAIIYGVLAVILAVVSGWLAGVAFRKS